MRDKVLLVATRLDAQLGQWYIDYLKRTGLKSSDGLRELVLFRMSCEKNPWGELGKLLKDKRGGMT